MEYVPADANPDADAAIDSLQETLGHRFRDVGLLRLALSTLKQPLTPATAAARQRLEFLGDAAWNYALALAVFQAHPEGAPGDLTRRRAAWSSRGGLARLARRLNLPFPGSAPLGPSQRVLAELLEAVLGAMVEDEAFDAIRVLAVRVVGQGGESATRPVVDAKSALQMAALARQERLPTYRLIDKRGPAHHPTFRVAVTVRGPLGEIRIEAEGGSRQAAEQEAARLALLRFWEPVPPPHNIS